MATKKKSHGKGTIDSYKELKEDVKRREKRTDDEEKEDLDLKSNIKSNEIVKEVVADLSSTASTRTYYSMLVSVSLLSLISRLYNIDKPAHVCWDETHFGKMGSWYIKREFFFDVHPPLGKMLIGLFGILTGYDGGFAFAKPGDEYGETHYVGMRVCCAVMGAAVVPLAYMSVWLLTKSLMSSLFAALLILLDVGTLTLSRHILLDPIMMFFIMMSTYSQLKFLSFRDRPFSSQWWIWLVFTGLFLASSIGVKFVGLFIILYVGILTVNDLWKILGNQTISLVEVVKHFLARALCLIILPILVYIALFAVHLRILNHSGNGDGFYSSAFQSQLIGNRLYNVSMPENVAFGSVITLKQRRTGGGYLHSHWHLYPEEHPPRQQQITTYAHKDFNNEWIIKLADQEPKPDDPVQLVVSGDLVRLEHRETRRNLHSHHEPAPLSRRQFQVSGYGVNGSGDANDVWVVEVVGSPPGTVIQTAKSRLRFIHYHVRCLLHSHDKKLPKWGWDQLEATCNPNMREPKALWSVEEITDNRLPNASFEIYSPSFTERFMESHAVMTQGNSGLKPREGEITSRPWQWPIDFRGQIFSGNNHRIYLLGNPIIFWGCLVAHILFVVYYLAHAVKVKRGHKENKAWTEHKETIFSACWWLLLGWSLHYLPFWPMTRVLYFHHYFPAFLFSAMLTGVILDHTVVLLITLVPDSMGSMVFHTVVGSITSGLILSFYLFSPLTYGMDGPVSHEEDSKWTGLKWLRSWDI